MTPRDAAKRLREKQLLRRRRNHERYFHDRYFDLIEVSEAILARLDLEAQDNEIFPCAAMREKLRQAILTARVDF